MGLVLSTSWNAFRHKSGHKIASEIQSLGFKELELSFNLTSSMVEEVRDLVCSGGIKVASSHNFCPIPEEAPSREEALPDYYSMSSLDQGERERAVAQTKKSIDAAAALGARAVVLHCGRVEISDRTKELMQLYAKGLKGSGEFKSIRSGLVRERQSKVKPFLNNTLKSLDELNAYAAEKRVSLGIENRVYYREIPSLDEIGLILKMLRGGSLFYWHDTGHAQIMENLGFAQAKSYLDLYAKDMLGIHLHDLSGCDDHMAPGSGDFDFTQLPRYVKQETIKVIEAHEPATPDEIKKSKKYLESLFDEKL
ncbi:sugar phosphate isomerase/epimerase family protein [Candidatus Omnitrophota bacterium]